MNIQLTPKEIIKRLNAKERKLHREELKEIRGQEYDKLIIQSLKLDIKMLLMLCKFQEKPKKETTPTKQEIKIKNNYVLNNGSYSQSYKNNVDKFNNYFQQTNTSIKGANNE